MAWQNLEEDITNLFSHTGIFELGERDAKTGFGYRLFDPEYRSPRALLARAAAAGRRAEREEAQAVAEASQQAARTIKASRRTNKLESLAELRAARAVPVPHYTITRRKGGRPKKV